ncbi:hypothetical protein HMPREF9622_01584 [Cutibacterium modestum HL037PA3]|uniref:Uncharacterized protein n=1 Tax=Cutibacterium modestum HL044PA1 TaxID=765109 RepID=A0ABN0C5Y3_9ACTN|nr:hypothetical protein HMPREF9621_01630 [Cutibacterium modestum HL037PA2]EFS92674.1 hypothetical protein HMPREF9607_01205 [Cutibacterium modestum HL044PA1]EFT15378.1 hypothetical protein HMPREF9622_01584 [Cutibacterium modestum HL037PA3]EGG26187.1 hypothetical protein PA08_2152 [Cutibacterium modestum P08]
MVDFLLMDECSWEYIPLSDFDSTLESESLTLKSTLADFS